MIEDEKEGTKGGDSNTMEDVQGEDESPTDPGEYSILFIYKSELLCSFLFGHIKNLIFSKYF